MFYFFLLVYNKYKQRKSVLIFTYKTVVKNKRYRKTKWATLSIMLRLRFMVLNTTFNSMSVISWRTILFVDETGENQRYVASHWQILSYNVVSSTPRHEWDSGNSEIRATLDIRHRTMRCKTKPAKHRNVKRWATWMSSPRKPGVNPDAHEG